MNAPHWAEIVADAQLEERAQGSAVEWLLAKYARSAISPPRQGQAPGLRGALVRDVAPAGASRAGVRSRAATAHASRAITRGRHPPSAGSSQEANSDDRRSNANQRHTIMGRSNR